jgi:fumarylacetoacetase
LARGETDPPPLPYLSCESDRAAGALSVQLQAWFRSERMRQARRPAVMLSCADAALAAYWTPAQIVAHHTSGGCNLRPGDLLGSGTLSGPGARQAGSLLELTSGGAHPLRLGEAEELAFLRDGDEIVLRGRCERPGHRSIGFGPCAGQIQGG